MFGFPLMESKMTHLLVKRPGLKSDLLGRPSKSPRENRDIIDKVKTTSNWFNKHTEAFSLEMVEDIGTIQSRPPLTEAFELFSGVILQKTKNWTLKTTSQGSRSLLPTSSTLHFMPTHRLDSRLDSSSCPFSSPMLRAGNYLCIPGGMLQ